MMATFTERAVRGAADFVMSYHLSPFHACEFATVASGQVLKAGEVVQLEGGKLIAATGLLSGDALVTDVIGVMFEAVDASGGDVANCTYIARSAELKDGLLTYPAESTAGGEKAATPAQQAEILADVRSRGHMERLLNGLHAAYRFHEEAAAMFRDTLQQIEAR
ncbi:MAG: head decoration protein [Mesorhizobium sp.]|nr:MAG: head decoration protein [Mesorhizobium sp.]